MIIKCDPKPVTSFSINIGNNQIAQTNCTKYLGVILDDKLSWYQHITNLEDRLARSLGIFYMTRHYLTSSALKSVYFCLVYSYLQYEIGAWGSVPKTTLSHLHLPYIINLFEPCFSNYRSYVTLLYHQSNLLKINYIIYHLEIAKMMHCLHSGKLPQTFDDYFVPVTSVHTHLTRKATHGKYFLHSISSEHGKISIRYHRPKIWDSVDNTLQRLSSIQKTLWSPPYLKVCRKRHSILD